MMENNTKNLAWSAFKQTGDINTFMEFMQIKNIEEEKEQNKPRNVKGYIDKQEL